MVDNPYILALSADLIFAARIRSAAEAAGVNVILAKNVEEFLTHVRESKLQLAMLDLDRRGLDVRSTVAAARSANVALLCYVSHVREDLIAVAKDAGADRVLARGAFAKNLPRILEDLKT